MGGSHWIRFLIIWVLVLVIGGGCRPYSKNGHVFPWRGRWRLVALYPENKPNSDLLKGREAVWGGHLEMYITDEERLFMEIPETGTILLKGVKVEKAKALKKDVKFIVIPAIRLDSMAIPGITDGFYDSEMRHNNYIAYFQTDWNRGMLKGDGRVYWREDGDPSIGGMVLEFELVGKE